MSDTLQPPGWLGPACDLLKEHGLDEAAEALACSFRDQRRGVSIRDNTNGSPDGPRIIRAVQTWVDDPAPKLQGLRIEIDVHAPLGFQIRVDFVLPGGRRHSVMQIVDGWELDRSRTHLPEVVGRHLEAMHRRTIDAIRRAAHDTPDRQIPIALAAGPTPPPGTLMALGEDGAYRPYRPFRAPVDQAEELLSQLETLRSRGAISRANASEIVRIVREGGSTVISEPFQTYPEIVIRDRHGVTHRFPLTP